MSEQTSTAPEDETSHTVLGVYDKTYIMVSNDDGILFIDQHAAHERVYTNNLKRGLITLPSSRHVPTYAYLYSRSARYA